MKSWISGLLAVAVGVGLFFAAGLSFSRVLTSSMTPWAKPGDYLVSVRPIWVRPGVGSVVIARPYFTEGGERLPPIAHRIVSGAQGTWQTQGDANPEADAWTVTEVDRVVVAKMSAAAFPYVASILAAMVIFVLLWPRWDEDDIDEVGPAPTGPPIMYYWPPDA